MAFPFNTISQEYPPFEILPHHVLTDQNSHCVPAQWMMVGGGALRLATGPLTPAEQRVTVLAVSGMSNDEIASQLPHNKDNVKEQLETAYYKLDASNRFNLLRRGIKEKIFRVVQPTPTLDLTSHDLNILDLIADGKIYSEIGKKIGLESYSVKADVIHIKNKTGVKRLGGLVLLTSMSGQISHDSKHKNHLYSARTPQSPTHEQLKRAQGVKVLPVQALKAPEAACPIIKEIRWHGGRISVHNPLHFSAPILRTLVLHTLGYDRPRITEVTGIKDWKIKDTISYLYSEAGLDAYNGAHAVTRSFEEQVYRVEEEIEPFDLTTRQRQILRLLASGYTEASAGYLLGVSKNTIATHSQHAQATMGVRRLPPAIFKEYMSMQLV